MRSAPSARISARTSNFDNIYGLAKSTAGDILAAMKALLALTAIVAVSATGAGFYYVSSASEAECSASKEECSASKEECDEKATCDEGAKPDCGTECTDQKKAEDQNPT